MLGLSSTSLQYNIWLHIKGIPVLWAGSFTKLNFSSALQLEGYLLIGSTRRRENDKLTTTIKVCQNN